MIPPRITDVTADDNYCLYITYENSEIKKYNIKKLLKNDFYKKLNNITYFKLAKSVQTTIEWPDGEDIDPNELYKNSSCIK